MDRSTIGRFCRIFARIFIVLFVILVILPLIVEYAMQCIDGGFVPGDDSIIVFRNMVDRNEVLRRILDIIKKF